MKTMIQKNMEKGIEAMLSRYTETTQFSNLEDRNMKIEQNIPPKPGNYMYKYL